MTDIKTLDARTADLAERSKSRDIMFEPYGEDINGAGQLWMTEEQLERAALRLTTRTRMMGHHDVRRGQSSPEDDGALVAQAYLKMLRSDRTAMDVIHRAAKLLDQEPAPLQRPKLSELKVHPSIQLASGAYFDFTDPWSTPLGIQDIAAGLSRVCRYNGQLAIGENEVYVVGQHGVLASENCDDDCDPLEALLHDRFESVGNDMTSPFKQLLPCYKEYEDRCEEATADLYGLPHPMTSACKRIDLRMLATEKRDLMPGDIDEDVWPLIRGVEPLPFKIKPWGPAEAKHRFLHRYYWLTEKRVPKPTDPYAIPHPDAPQAWISVLTKAWGFDPTEEFC